MLVSYSVYDWVYFKMLRTKHVIISSFSMKGKSLLVN
jgi:hypothetical protein